MGRQTARKSKRHKKVVSRKRYRRLLEKCRDLPPTDLFIIKDYVTNLLITVLDLRLETTTVERALQYYRANCASQVGTFAELKLLLESGIPDRDIARRLCGYGYGNRIATLRGFVQFLESIGVTSQSALEAWARAADFERDFKGRVSGLAYAAFKWLVMRLGVDTIKPDVHVLNFVATTLGFRLNDAEAVSILERVA
jgi:hypothetical protein